MPRIEMTRTVRIALFVLRIYLIVLLGLIALKFVRTFTNSSPRAEAPAAAEENPRQS